MGLLGAGVSGASRQLGHLISVVITAAMMLLVLGFVYSKVKLRKQLPGSTWVHWYGPSVSVFVAALFIIADPTRHLMLDTGFWQGCGNNEYYPRVNETWSESCRWSASQYHCEKLCYVPNGGSAFCDENPDNVGCGGDLTGKLHEFYSQGEIDRLLCINGVDPSTCVEPDDMCHCTDHEDFSNLSMIGYIFTIGFTYFGFVLLTFGVMWNAEIVKKFAKIKSQFKALRDPQYKRKLKQEADAEVGFVREKISEHKVLMFSKTTCPFCFNAKEALDKELAAESKGDDGETTRNYEVVELDLVENGPAIQDALEIVTGGRTVPRVFVNGEFIGGGDDTVAKQASGELKKLIAASGIAV